MKTLFAAPALAFLTACSTLPPSELETPPLVIKTPATSFIGLFKSKMNYALNNTFTGKQDSIRDIKLAGFLRPDGSVEKLDCSELNGKWSLAIVNRTQDGISKRELRELDTQIAQYKEADRFLGCPRIKA